MSLPFLHLLQRFVITSKLTNLPLNSPDLLPNSRLLPVLILLSIPPAGVHQIRTTLLRSSSNDKSSFVASRLFEVTLELVAAFGFFGMVARWCRGDDWMRCALHIGSAGGIRGSELQLCERIETRNGPVSRCIWQVLCLWIEDRVSVWALFELSRRIFCRSGTWSLDFKFVWERSE